MPSKSRLYFNTGLCCLLIMTAAAVYSFGLYSQALRNQMGYSALGNQFVYNFSLLGRSISGIMTGFMMKNVGIPKTLSIAALMSTSGYLLSALAVRKYFECPAELMWVFAFVGAFGQGFANILAVVTNVSNFPVTVRGKIVGLQTFFIAFSSLFFSLIWDNVFVDDPDDDSPESAQVAEYFIFLGIFYGVLYLFGAAVVKKWDAEEIIPTSSDYHKSSQDSTPVKAIVFVPAPITYVLPSVSYIVLTYMYCVFAGVDKTYVGDLGKIGESLDAKSMVSNHVIIFAACSACARLTAGVLYDRYRKIPPWIWLEIPCILVLLLDILLVFFLDPLYKSYASTIFAAITNMMYSIIQITIANRYGKDNMADCWSIMIGLAAVTMFAFGAWNSAIYENGIPPDSDDNICVGSSCFTLAFIISGGIVVTAITALALLSRDSHHEQHFKEDNWVTTSECPSSLPTTWWTNSLAWTWTETWVPWSSRTSPQTTSVGLLQSQSSYWTPRKILKKFSFGISFSNAIWNLYLVISQSSDISVVSAKFFSIMIL